MPWEKLNPTPPQGSAKAAGQGPGVKRPLTLGSSLPPHLPGGVYPQGGQLLCSAFPSLRSFSWASIAGGGTVG